MTNHPPPTTSARIFRVFLPSSEHLWCGQSSPFKFCRFRYTKFVGEPQIIEQTADKIGSPSEYDSTGHSIKYGYGRVNAANAVRKAMGLQTETHQVLPSFSHLIPDPINAEKAPKERHSGRTSFM